MHWINSIRAAKLSKRGEHAAALALSRGRDVRVLSSAGMHLSVLRSRSPHPLEKAIALAHTGLQDEALHGLPAIPNLYKARGLLGQLALYSPGRVLGAIGNRPEFADIRSYCEHILGCGKHSPESLATLPTGLGVYIALSNGWIGTAKRLFERGFILKGLIPPSVDWEGGRLDLSSIRTGALPAVDSPDLPLVSIVLTAYNEERYMGMAVSSVLKQTWPAIELIIVDDGSTDRTYEMAKQLENIDHRVKAIRLPKNRGTWFAKNEGLKLATGDFISMHDADDWSHPQKIALQLEPLLRDPGVMCSSSYLLRVSMASGLPFSRNAASFLRWNACSLLYRREALTNLGNYFMNLLGGDCEYAARIETRWGAHSHRKIRMPLTIGWQRTDSLSTRYRTKDRITCAPLRLRHWEAWRQLHADWVARRGRKSTFFSGYFPLEKFPYV